MADYEELVELGFEGIDRFANKYHDTVYDHLPAWRRKQQKQQAQAQAQAQAQQNQTQPQPANEQQRTRELPEQDRNEIYHNDNMSSYAHSQYPPYADRGQEYRSYPDARDARYVQEETSYRRSPNAGAIVMRDREVYADRPGYDVDPRDISPQRNYGYGYDDRQVRARPGPNRTRSTSWSPPRNQRYDDEGSRRRRRSRSRSQSRDEDSSWHKGRLAATLVGGLLGGVAGNQIRKGQKYDTAATVGGAVLGGIASSEIAERFERKKDEKRKERDREDHAWEQKHGDGGRYDNDRRRSREYRGDGDWCDRCRCDMSRCRCR